jgi:hypothetical protein
MWKRTSQLAFLAIVAVVVATCVRFEPGPETPAQPTPPPPTSQVQPVASPEAGKASLSGVLYSYVLSRAIPGTVFYLTKPVVADGQALLPVLLGPRKEMGDVQGLSDPSGRFVLNNIPPGDYYLLVWAPYNWVLAETSSETRFPLLVRLVADRAQDLGTVFFPWP